MNNNKAIYFPGLNGLRAIAALAVVLSHTTQYFGDFGLDPYVFGKTYEGQPRGIELGAFGVSIFFTLSGFLITYLLLKEKESRSLNIKNFYFRRILRIWPLYYLNLALTLITIYFWKMPFQYNTLAFYVFLAANIPYILGFYFQLLIHYWSLGVEEQFYLFWPWFVKLQLKKLTKLIWVLIAGLLFLKIVFHLLRLRYQISIPYLTLHVTRFHCMLFGCIGAILYYQRNKIFINLASHFLTQIICWTAILALAINRFHFFSIIDNELVSLVGLCLIISQAQGKNRIINLENNIMDFLGKISYGIYIFHLLIIFYFSKLFPKIKDIGFSSYVLVYLMVVITCVAVAWLSYQYFEKRFLRLKLRYSVVPSTSAKHF